jgi:hypothetical protein
MDGSSLVGVLHTGTAGLAGRKGQTRDTPNVWRRVVVSLCRFCIGVADNVVAAGTVCLKFTCLVVYIGLGDHGVTETMLAPSHRRYAGTQAACAAALISATRSRTPRRPPLPRTRPPRCSRQQTSRSQPSSARAHPPGSAPRPPPLHRPRNRTPRQTPPVVHDMSRRRTTAVSCQCDRMSVCVGAMRCRRSLSIATLTSYFHRSRGRDSCSGALIQEAPSEVKLSSSELAFETRQTGKRSGS